MARRRCLLHGALGRAERCSDTECPFWETDGPADEPGCLLGRFLPAEDWTRELADRWLSIRLELEEKRSVITLMGHTAAD
jgi:hypothetical protein